MGESNSVGDKFRQPCPAPEFVGLIRGRGRLKRRAQEAALFEGNSIKPTPFDGPRVTGASGPPEPFGGCLSLFLQADAIR